MNWALLLNSLVVSGLVTLLAAGLGLVVAAAVAGLSPGWRGLVLGMAAVALAMPPFLVTNSWLSWLGQTGWLRRWLPLNLYSLGGTVWLLGLMLWPVVMFLVLGAWQRIEPAQYESDPALQGWGAVRWLLLPAAAPALGQAVVLVFVLALNHFAVPALLQVKVFPAELWFRFSTTFDYGAVLALSLPLVLAPLALLLWLRRQPIAWPHLEGATPPALWRRQLGWHLWLPASLAAGLALGLSVLAPLGQVLLARGSWRELPGAFGAGQSAILTSAWVALLAAALTVLCGVVGWRWRGAVLLWLLLFAPGVLLGMGLIYGLNRPILDAVYQSTAVLVLALTLRYLALGWHGAAWARRGVDPALTEAARLDGASGWQLFRHVHGPQMWPTLAAVAYVVYLLCLWEVETLILIVPPGGETLALRIFNLLHYGHNTQVNALCLLLLGLAVVPLLAWGLARWFARLSVRSVALSLLAIGWATGCAPAPDRGAELQSRFFSHAEVIGARGNGAGQFVKPRSVAVDADDNLYVVDMTGRVQKFSPTGAYLLSWQMPQTELGRPKGMGLDPAGHVVVVEPHYARVNHFTTDGRLARQWGERGTNTGQVVFPRAVAFAPSGRVWVSEYGAAERVQQFDADGTRSLRAFGRFGSGPGEFNRPEGLGLDGFGRLFVADSCNHRVQVFSPEGQWLGAYGRAGSGAGELSYPYDVRVDRVGNQFVCEFGNSRIQVFDGAHQPLETIGGPGAGPGQFSNPWSIALDSAGNLYVADGGNHRVQKLVRRPLT
ncbi:MAG: hypothetical protein FJ387_20810 [Verrucomicrobia bacterium]|nr:hypothetical protein [Verrucomicrobiota bacterium]